MRITAIAALLSTGLACAPHHPRERPFTREWGTHVKGEQAFERRQARIDGDDIVLMGEEGAARAAITRDQTGDPKLEFGGMRGFSADVDYRRGPAGRIKYKREFDFARPVR